MDKKNLKKTISLAKKNLGFTSPNPVVGCIIVKNDKIISSSVTQKGGRPHAEARAIAAVKDKKNLIGATLYSSLEPCCHHGKSGPCTDIIIKSGISRVVFASFDNDKRVSGKGAKTLEENSVEAKYLHLDEAYELNKGFFKVQDSKIPYITSKFAVSLDGKIALKNNKSKWITGPKSRKYGHYLRLINDAIMIGANSLRHDNPMLNCRIEGLENHNPRIIVVSSSANFDKNLNIFRFQDKPILITNNKDADSNLFKVINCPDENNNLDITLGLKILSEKYEINSILVEGGSFLNTYLLKHDLIDEINWIQSSKIIGSDGISAVCDLKIEEMDKIINNFTRTEVKKIDDYDLLSVYKKNKPIL